MSLRHGRAALFALLAGSAAGLEAQATTASLAAGAVSVRFAERGTLSAATLSPTLSVRSARASAGVSGTLSQIAADTWSRQGTAHFSVFTPPSARGLQAEVGASAGGSRFSDGASTAQLLGSLRGHWLGTQSAAWVGAGGGSMYDGFAWRSVRQLDVGATWLGWREQLTLAVTPAVTDDTLAYTDLLALYATGVGVVDVSLSVGGRLGATLPIAGGDQRLWGGLSLTTWVAPRTALVLGAGTYPVDVTQGFPAGQYLSLNLRVGLPRSVFSQRAAEHRRLAADARADGITEVSLRRRVDDQLELRVHAPGAREVEVNGDVTRWVPQRLTKGRGGWWTGRFTSSARVVELVLRTDGGPWIVPPGADLVTDEFGGRVGRVLVP